LKTTIYREDYPAVPQIIKNSTIFSSEPSNREGFKTMYWLTTKMETKGEAKVIVVAVLEDENGKFFKMQTEMKP